MGRYSLSLRREDGLPSNGTMIIKQAQLIPAKLAGAFGTLRYRTGRCSVRSIEIATARAEAWSNAAVHLPLDSKK